MTAPNVPRLVVMTVETDARSANTAHISPTGVAFILSPITFIHLLIREAVAVNQFWLFQNIDWFFCRPHILWWHRVDLSYIFSNKRLFKIIIVLALIVRLNTNRSSSPISLINFVSLELKSVILDLLAIFYHNLLYLVSLFYCTRFSVNNFAKEMLRVV